MRIAASRATLDDVFSLLQKLSDKVEDHEKEFKVVHQEIDTLTTIVANSAGDIKQIQENMLVSDQHSRKHFDKNEEQDRRFDVIEQYLYVPHLAI